MKSSITIPTETTTRMVRISYLEKQISLGFKFCHGVPHAFGDISIIVDRSVTPQINGVSESWGRHVTQVMLVLTCLNLEADAFHN